MPAYRIGLGSDFNLNNQLVGIGTTTAGYKLTVANVLKGDFNITGVTTLTSYGGFVGQKQNISIASSVGFTTTGIGTVGITSFISTNEKDYGYISLIGEYNTVSEDIVVDEGRIFDISTITNIGITTLGTQSVYVPTSSVVNVGTLESLNIASHFSFPNGGIAARPEEPIEGTVRFNDDLNTLEFYNGVEWRQFTVDGSSGRGIMGGGNPSSPTADLQKIDFVNISTQGNSTDFGILTTTKQYPRACSSSTRGIFMSGSVPALQNVLDYITIAAQGNAIDFGDLTQTSFGGGALSSSTRGVFHESTNPTNNVISYVQIATIGNAVDFGDMVLGIRHISAFSSPTRGVFTGGYNNPLANNNYLQSITIASTGNAIYFGDMTKRLRGAAGFSNSVRGCYGGGIDSPTSTVQNAIDYVTIATLGNAIDFGDLVSGRRTEGGGCSNQIRGLFTGGYSPADTNQIDFITIATTGNAQDFGDCAIAGTRGALSDSHGGLGGF